jgi:hypothetical protein
MKYFNIERFEEEIETFALAADMSDENAAKAARREAYELASKSTDGVFEIPGVSAFHDAITKYRKERT